MRLMRLINAVIAILGITAVLFVITVLFATSAATSAELPALPAGAVEVSSARPIAQCGGNYGVYVRLYDLAPDEPNNPASAAVFGVFETLDGELRLGEPVLIILRDRQGKDRAYLRHGPGAVVEYEWEAFYAAYPEPCSIPGIVPRKEETGGGTDRAGLGIRLASERP